MQKYSQVVSRRQSAGKKQGSWMKHTHLTKRKEKKLIPKEGKRMSTKKMRMRQHIQDSEKVSVKRLWQKRR